MYQLKIWLLCWKLFMNLTDFNQIMERRTFLINSGMSVAGALLLPLNFGCKEKNPNDLITIGMIGVGLHGIERNLKHYLKYPELCRVIAVCDVSLTRAQSAKNLVNNTYKSRDCIAYQDFRELLDNKSIDAVQISTPDHWHVPISVMAALKGKHICCEKPTLTISEGRLLCDVIKKTGVIYQISIEDRYLGAYHKMAEVALNGRLGAIKHIEISLPVGQLPKSDLEITVPPKDLNYDLWLGPAQEVPFIYSRTFYHFRWYDAFSGGLLTDWGAHYCDTAQLASGNEFSGPAEVNPVGDTLYYRDGIFNTAYQFDLQYKYPNSMTMRVKSGDALIRIEGGEEWIQSAGWNNKLETSNNKILDLTGKNVVLPIANDEIIDFLKAIKSGRKPSATAEAGHRTSSLLHCGNIALKLNRKVIWNCKDEHFENDPEADKFRKREMRDQWSYSRICPGFKYE